MKTQFQYQDVGVNIEMTPTVHYRPRGHVEDEDRSDLGGQRGHDQGVTEPIIAQHTSEQMIRLREGEASILGGILQKAGPGQLDRHSGAELDSDLVKYLFGSKDHTITDDEIVFLVVPHIVRSQELTPVNLRPIDTGTGQAVELRHVSDGDHGPERVGCCVASRVRQSRWSPRPGTVPGQSAQAAAPAALAQMNAAARGNGERRSRRTRSHPPQAPVPG